MSILDNDNTQSSLTKDVYSVDEIIRSKNRKFKRVCVKCEVTKYCVAIKHVVYTVLFRINKTYKLTIKRL